MEHLPRMPPSTTVFVCLSPANIQYIYSEVLAYLHFHCIAIYLCHVSQQTASFQDFYWKICFENCFSIPWPAQQHVKQLIILYWSHLSPQKHITMIYSYSLNWDTKAHHMNIAEIGVYIWACNHAYSDLWFCVNQAIMTFTQTQKKQLLFSLLYVPFAYCKMEWAD